MANEVLVTAAMGEPSTYMLCKVKLFVKLLDVQGPHMDSIYDYVISTGSPFHDTKSLRLSNLVDLCTYVSHTLRINRHFVWWNHPSHEMF